MAVSILKSTELCWWWAQKYCFSFSHIFETYCHGCILLILVFLQSIKNQWFLLPLNSYVVRSPTLKNYSLQIRKNLIYGILAPKREQSTEHILFSSVSADSFQGTKAQCWSKISPQWHRRQASVYWSYKSYKKWTHL